MWGSEAQPTKLTIDDTSCAYPGFTYQPAKGGFVCILCGAVVQNNVISLTDCLAHTRGDKALLAQGTLQDWLYPVR